MVLVEKHGGIDFGDFTLCLGVKVKRENPFNGFWIFWSWLLLVMCGHNGNIDYLICISLKEDKILDGKFGNLEVKVK